MKVRFIGVIYVESLFNKIYMEVCFLCGSFLLGLLGIKWIDGLNILLYFYLFYLFYLQEVIMSFYIFQRCIFFFVIQRYFFVIRLDFILVRVEDYSVFKRLLACVVMVLKTSGLIGIYVEMNVGDKCMIDYYQRMGFFSIVDIFGVFDDVVYLGRVI